MGAFPMILVTILEGKNFPVRHDKRLIVEAKFDGEVMGSEPVPHITFPQIQTEFAWEVDRKGLQMHRLQRTPIKLLWYAVDQELMRKESIGYIILDLRLAQERDLAPTWYPLLNCKYHREKPEVKIRLSLEKEACSKTPSGDGGFSGTRTYTLNEMREFRRQHSADAIPKIYEKASVTTLPIMPSIKNLEPTLLPESCCYRIGNPEQCHESFTFSITLAFAANLNKLSQSSVLRSSKDFYFYYSLFENDVMTARFTSLLNPDFRAERASVKISSSTELLSTYFQQHSHLKVTLYCGDVRLASGNILLHEFASVKHHNIDKEPLCIEDNVQLHPLVKPSRLPTSEDLSPFVGVTVVLQKDTDPVSDDSGIAPPNVESNSVRPPTLSQQSRFSNRIYSTMNGHNTDEINGNGSTTAQRDQPDKPVYSTHIPLRTQVQHHTNINGNRGNEVPQSNGTNCTAKTPQSILGSSKNTPTWTNGNRTPHNSSTNDNVPCHFCFSLDLCHFHATHLDHPVNVFIRYCYPFFGSSASIVTQPDVEVLPGSTVNISSGFCSFNFATTLGLLKSTFCETPLILEMIHRKNQASKQEQLIGTSRVNLFQIFNSVLTSHTDGKKSGTRQMCSCKVPITSSDGHEMGDLSAIITLDDYGPTSPVCDKNTSKTKTPTLSQLRGSMSSFDVPSIGTSKVQRPNGFTQDELIQAAFEIELWKERQREIFRAELKEKEMQHLKILVTEWKQRDTEREVLLQRRLHECQKLEDKLKQMLQDSEIKEKQLTARETELSVRIQNFDKEQEQREKDMTFEVEKIRMEYEDLIRIDRLKQLELEETIASLKRKIHVKDAEIQENRNTIESLRNQANKQPDAELKTEVNILKMEKSELKDKFDVAISSKQKYKLQWSQAVRQISVLQQKIGALERLILAKKDEELASLQQRVACDGDKHQPQQNGMQGQAMSKMTERVNGFQLTKKSSEENEQESPSSQSASESLPATTPNTTADPKNFGLHTEQLKAQKENLLGSGMYSESDAIIKTLNIYIDKSKQIST